MKKYDEQLYVVNSIRSRVSAVANAAISLTAVICGITSNDVISERVWYAVAVASSVSGIVSMSRHDDNRKASEDVSNIADQVRTNRIYQRLSQGDEPFDYSASAYNYVAMQLGRGVPYDEILSSVDKNPMKARQVVTELEQRYGKLPTGDV